MGLSSKLMVNRDAGIGDDRDQSGASSAKMKRQASLQARAEAAKCPRCDSANTKFCYYNNYNKSQPRHFCRACKRHWTKGGTLRNVPVGGGRKNKRSKKSPADNKPAFPPSGEEHDEKSTVSEILYRAVAAQPPALSPFAELRNGLSFGPEFDVVSTLAFPQTLRMLSGTSSQFESSLSSMSSSFQATEFNCEDGIGKAISGDHVNAMPGESQWKQAAETPSYEWNFEDIDTLVSSDHINLPWDESLQIDQHEI